MVQFYVSEPLKLLRRWVNNSIGVDNHTWVLRDAFVEAIIPGSIVQSFRKLPE